MDSQTLAYNTGIMRRGVKLCLLAACLLRAQEPQGAGPAERAARLMVEAAKLGDQRTGKAMEEAIADYRQAAPLWRELGNPEGEAKALEQIGVLSLRMGNLQPALENLTAALPIFRAAGNKREELEILNDIGLAQSRQGNQRAAIDFESQALRLAEEIGDRGEQGVVHNNLGLAYHEMGDEPRAIDEFEKATPLHREVGNVAAEGAAWSNIGAIHYTQGDLQQSLDAFERALALRRQGKDRRGEANTIGKIGVLRHAFGQDEESLAGFQTAIDILREVGDHLEESTDTMNMGNVYMAQGRYTQAVELFDRALRLQETWGKSKDWATGLSYKAVALTAMKKYEEARKALDAALEAQRSFENRRGEAEALGRLARLQLDEGKPAEGAQSAAESARIAESIGEKRTRSEAQYQLARCRRAEGRHADALAAVDQALRISESVRESVPDYDLRASFFSRVRDQYDLKVDLEVKMGDVAAAFETAEASRARSLLELIRSRVSVAAAPEINPQLAELQKELDPNTVALEYSLGNDASYVFVMTPDSIRALPLLGRAAIEAAARRLYAKWSARQDSPADNEELSKMLLGPVRAGIRGKRVVVVPDGALAYIPFDALYVSPGRRLIEDYDVATMVSLSALKLVRDGAREHPPAPKLVAVFADPVFGPNDSRVRGGAVPGAPAAPNAELVRSVGDVGLKSLDRLASTRREAAAIAALAAPSQRREALDFDASATAVKDSSLGDYRIIHFATHGLMNSRDPHLSGLVFSMVDRQGRPQNGFLRSDDLAALKLRADLVVLSACQTALGKELRGEGLLGLARGFMYAGAPRVIASLWRVADTATADLMSSFYQGLLRSHVPASEALRMAKTGLMRNPLRASPYYWAGFVLQGDWR
jgi:CHAT domain-containing protein/Tfp pilus assembly protein PilF